MNPSPYSSPGTAASAQPASSFLKRSAWRRVGLATALLAALWLVLLASLSAGG